MLNNQILKTCYIKKRIDFISLRNNDDDITYFLQTFQFNINSKKKDFSFFIYKGQINSINIGLDEDNLIKNKSYEIIYLSKTEMNLPEEVNVSNYRIKDYDKFNCTHRKRFNIMNIKIDKTLYNNNTDLSSLEIIYLINKNNKKIKYGVFDINSYINYSINRPNYEFDKDVVNFANAFYDEYIKSVKSSETLALLFNSKTTELQDNKDNNNNLYIKLTTNIIEKISLSNYNKQSLSNRIVYEKFRNYYLYLYCFYLKTTNQWDMFNLYMELVKKLDDQGYTPYNKIRILTEFIFTIFYFNSIPSFTIILKLDNNNSYFLAIQLQKDIINNITEISNIFYPLLQLNSKILKLLPSDSPWDIIKKKQNFS